MLSIEDTENLIKTMRAQARALDAGADSLEAAIAPLKAALSSAQAFNQLATTMFEFWSGQAVAKSMSKPDKLDFTV